MTVEVELEHAKTLEGNRSALLKAWNALDALDGALIGAARQEVIGEELVASFRLLGRGLSALNDEQDACLDRAVAQCGGVPEMGQKGGSVAGDLLLLRSLDAEGRFTTERVRILSAGVRLPPPLAERVLARCEDAKTSVRQLIEAALARYLEEPAPWRGEER